MVPCHTRLHGLLASCSRCCQSFTEEITHPRSYLGIGVSRWKCSDVCPVQKFVHNTETCFLVTRTLNHCVAAICSTGLSDQGRGLLPLFLEHLLMNCHLGSSPLPFKFSSQALSLLMGVHHGALGLITSLAFFMGACISKNSLSWSLY